MPLGPFRRQSDTMFETAMELLREHGATFREVLRTWIYLDDIDRDYQALNDSRNAFFQREDVRRLPASTGIGGKLHPRGTLCTLDVYALLNPGIAQVEVMRTPTLNEAPQYGSSFSRGMKMALPEQTYLFISGTASVDEQGQTAHVGDVRGQLERMLLNIEGLLAPQGAAWSDLVQGVTFLKSPEYAEVYRELCEERGIVDVPHTVVQADVCRPELLSEMEAIAVVPTRRA
jgi:enamine deaminase RidA (YjgF/YER057c/UK114 family)